MSSLVKKSSVVPYCCLVKTVSVDVNCCFSEEVECCCILLF